MVRADGIEPTRPAWKAGVLPLNYAREAQGRSFSGIYSPSSAQRVGCHGHLRCHRWESRLGTEGCAMVLYLMHERTSTGPWFRSKPFGRQPFTHMKIMKKILALGTVGAMGIVLAGCTSGTRGNSDSTPAGAIDASTSNTTRATGGGGSASGATGSSTMSGPNNVGGTIGSGSGSTGGTGLTTGAAGGGR
jgi:hypothetical protein